MTDPVCSLERTLYEHPLCGSQWENYCIDIAVNKCGFVSIPGWECLFYRPEKRTLLSIYVDDFKIAGPCNSVGDCWSMLGKYFAFDNPEPFGRYLGCDQVKINMSPTESMKRLENIVLVVFKDKPEEGGMKWSDTIVQNCYIRAIEYDMCEFMSSCADRCCELSGTNRNNLKNVVCLGVGEQQLKLEKLK